MTAPAPSPIAERELVLTRIIDVSADKLFKCWTTPGTAARVVLPAALDACRTPRWTYAPAAPA
jgi:uncharacterized protein YndB with AHSA1/START domain